MPRKLTFDELILLDSCIEDVKDRLTEDGEYTARQALVFAKFNHEKIKQLMVIEGYNPYDTIAKIKNGYGYTSSN